MEGGREDRDERRVTWKASDVTFHQESSLGRNRMEGVTLVASRKIYSHTNKRCMAEIHVQYCLKTKQPLIKNILDIFSKDFTRKSN